MAALSFMDRAVYKERRKSGHYQEGAVTSDLVIFNLSSVRQWRTLLFEWDRMTKDRTESTTTEDNRIERASLSRLNG